MIGVLGVLTCSGGVLNTHGNGVPNGVPAPLICRGRNTGTPPPFHTAKIAHGVPARKGAKSCL